MKRIQTPETRDVPRRQALGIRGVAPADRRGIEPLRPMETMSYREPTDLQYSAEDAWFGARVSLIKDADECEGLARGKSASPVHKEKARCPREAYRLEQKPTLKVCQPCQRRKAKTTGAFEIIERRSCNKAENHTLLSRPGRGIRDRELGRSKDWTSESLERADRAVEVSEGHPRVGMSMIVSHIKTERERPAAWALQGSKDTHGATGRMLATAGEYDKAWRVAPSELRGTVFAVELASRTRIGTSDGATSDGQSGSRWDCCAGVRARSVTEKGRHGQMYARPWCNTSPHKGAGNKLEIDLSTLMIRTCREHVQKREMMSLAGSSAKRETTCESFVEQVSAYSGGIQNPGVRRERPNRKTT